MVLHNSNTKRSKLFKMIVAAPNKKNENQETGMLIKFKAYNTD